MQLTVVMPTGKASGELTATPLVVQVMTGVGVPLAVTLNETDREHWPDTLLVTMSLGQVMTGGTFVLIAIQTFVAVQVKDWLSISPVICMMSVPGVGPPSYMKPTEPSEALMSKSVVSAFGPLTTRKVTNTSGAGTPLVRMVPWRMWVVETALVARAGSSVQVISGTQRSGGKSAENSLVLPFVSVAVAVKIGPMGTALNVALKMFVPLAAVVTLVKP